jgi:hypothetical protein
VPKVLVKNVSPECSAELQMLAGLVLEARRFGPFADLPPLPKGGCMTIDIAFGFCPSACEVRSAWVVEIDEIVRALAESGQPLAALRFKKREEERRIKSFRPALSFPVGDPAFELMEVA